MPAAQLPATNGFSGVTQRPINHQHQEKRGIMRHLRITIAAVAVAAAASVGGVTLASTSGTSSAHGTGGTSATQSANGGNATPNAALVQVAMATVQGSAKKILVDSHGLPLYIYQPDTARTSQVTGRLATLWPPLISANPTDPGAPGQVTSIDTTNGKQASYNGHFLSTFVEDRPGQVTGQGVQNFFVATPTLGAGAASDTSAPPAQPGYHY
jgi:predicted lipoprotein with Yx(FWY)xxD motif